MYSEEFQYDVLYLLANDITFSFNYIDFIHPEYFDRRELKIIFKCIMKYVTEYEEEIDEKNLKLVVDDYLEKRNIYDDEAKSVLSEVTKIYNIKVPNVNFVRDRLVKFITSQRLKLALLKSVDILDRGENFEEVLKLVDEALAVGNKVDTGLCFEDIENITSMIHSSYNRERMVRTGFSKFDEALMGGISSEEVHVIQGRPKDGKSTLACNVGTFASLSGKNVFHVSGEIKKLDVMIKYACRMTGMTYRELFSADAIEFQRRIQRFINVSPRLFINSYPEGTASCIDIQGWISRIKSQTGISPDLIIIDYDECLRPSSSYIDGDLYGNSGKVYDDMISLAERYQCGILTFAQPKRESWQLPDVGELIESYNISHSSKKIMKCFSASSLNFKSGENRGILYLDLARRGYSKVKIPIIKDLSRALFVEDKSNEEA